MPSKVYGILAAGKPFLARRSSRSGAALIAEEYGCGMRVDPGDPQALADGVLAMRDEDLDSMGKRGREALETRFDRWYAADRYDQALRRVVAGPPLIPGSRRPCRSMGDRIHDGLRSTT